jgi:glycosyltransferase involved in cell wall biosynthesis
MSDLKISVVIPAFNAERTIEETLNSVFQQTMPPFEILVMDDGSTDGTSSLLRGYSDRIKVFRQTNQGLSASRNALIKKAAGTVISFLDADDMMHPLYLEILVETVQKHGNAVGFFMGHFDFSSRDPHHWREIDKSMAVEIMPGSELFRRLYRNPAIFACGSCFSAPKKTLTELGESPFMEDGSEDFYCYSLLSLKGITIYNPNPLMAYRVHSGSLSSNRVRGLQALVRVFERLEPRFSGSGEFASSFASHRRNYAKYLLGGGRVGEAREQLMRSMTASRSPSSIAKSLGMYALTYFPHVLQPQWPTAYRLTQ